MEVQTYITYLLMMIRLHEEHELIWTRTTSRCKVQRVTQQIEKYHSEVPSLSDDLNGHLKASRGSQCGLALKEEKFQPYPTGKESICTGNVLLCYVIHKTLFRLLG
jgi:hypothetical protein